jgi:hypothetical protein
MTQMLVINAHLFFKIFFFNETWFYKLEALLRTPNMKRTSCADWKGLRSVLCKHRSTQAQLHIGRHFTEVYF